MKSLFVISLLVLSFSSLANSRFPANPAVPLFKSLEILAGEDLTCVKDSDCDAIAYGSRACGGPAGYVVVSNHNEKYTLITEVAKLSVSSLY